MRCLFPVWIGQSNVNYGTYDILWSSGDTTTPINVTAQSTYTLYTIDHATGCIMYDTTVVADQGLLANPLADTTYACNGTGYFDLSLGGYIPNTWEEFDMSWNIENIGTNPDFNSFDGGGNDYVVVNCTTTMGCPVIDTTYVDYSGAFSFSLGPDITTSVTPVIVNGPAGYPGYLWTPLNVSTASVQIYTSGTYYLLVDNGQGCNYTDTIVITILPTSVSENFGVVAVNAFPNPANEQVTIVTSEAISQVHIFSTDGALVQTKAVTDSLRVEINTRELAEGYYIIEVVTANGVGITKMVISR